jgi:chitinase
MGAFQLRRATISSNILLFFLLATHVLCDSDQSQKPTPPSQPADITFRSGPHQNIKHKGPDPLQVGLDAINFQLATTPRGLWFGGNGTSGPHVRTALADSQCGPGRPCDDGSCCSEDGHCGFFPQHCGSGCQSNCHAKAPCGVNAAPGKEHCPLNLCCSYYGWCGTEAVHCIDPEPQFGKTPCQQGYGKCEVLQPPQCGGNSASSGRKIGYYQAFQRDRKCNYVAPGDINTDGFTHLFFAFAFFDPGDFSLRFAHKEDEDVVKEFTALQRPGLQTWLAIGGWDFNEPGPWQKAFHNMVSTQHGRATLIANLQLAILKWKFQGIDIDWEYPGEEKRGGSSEDGDNLVLFVKELRQALGSKYGISITLAPDWGYLQYFKPKEMEPYVDFFGFMGYDLHGQWDSENALGSKVRPHSDTTEIERNLRPLWYDGVNPAKINLGMAFYGRTYKLSDPGCTTYGCGFKGAGSAGRCSAFDGVLTNAEITELWLTKGYEQHLNSTSMTKWMVYDNDNWVGFDDPITHHMKLGFADKRCLGGSMYWSVDQDPTAHVSEKRPDKQAGSGDLFGENKDQCPNDRGWETKVCPPSTGDMPLSRDPKDLWKDAAAGGLWCELMTRMKREFTETGGMSADFRANAESQRIAALMGHGDPTNFGCGANPQGGCTTSTACYDARTPAGALILTSMYEVASVSGVPCVGELLLTL